MKKAKWFLFILLFLTGLIWLYTNSLIGVNKKSKEYLAELEEIIIKEKYSPNYFVISGRRWKVDNYILSKFGGAAKNSVHKKGQAIDIIILDINKDGISNYKDVDIVYKILDKKIIKNKGGLGSYKNESGFFNKQMIHFDSRGKKARWNR